MIANALNPLQDDRWGELVARDPAASVFHTRGWVDALRRTYGYEPVVYTTSPPDGGLTNGILFCRISSWLTGRRLVSLPFADHCEPLVTRPEDRTAILDGLRSAASDCRYVELRPICDEGWDAPGLGQANSFKLHLLDLRPELDELFGRTHHSTFRRNVRRAGREGLTCENGRSNELLETFYRLTLLTRRRQGLPPQPREWFANLVACLGDRMKVHVARKDGRAIGSIVTLRHGRTLVYKYGCSDARFHNLGTMPFLFWCAIQDAKADGLETFDLGRTDADNSGLAAFKDRLGATASTLTYRRLSSRRPSTGGFRMHIPPALITRMPDRVLVAAGRFIYRHIG